MVNEQPGYFTWECFIGSVEKSTRQVVRVTYTRVLPAHHLSGNGLGVFV